MTRSGIRFTAPTETVVMIKETPMGPRLSNIVKGDLDKIDPRVIRAPRPGEVEELERTVDEQVPYSPDLAPMVEASPERLLHEQLKANPEAAKELRSDSENEDVRAALAMVMEMRDEVNQLKAELTRRHRPRCPQCGEDFKTDQGVMVHVTRKHPELRGHYESVDFQRAEG